MRKCLEHGLHDIKVQVKGKYSTEIRFFLFYFLFRFLNDYNHVSYYII